MKKKSMLHLIRIVGGVLISGVCHADLIYSEPFLNTTTGALPFSDYGWRANHGTNAAVYDSSSSNNSEVPVIAYTDYIYINTGIVPGGDAAVFWTDDQIFGSITCLTNISFRTSCGSTAQAIRIAVRVDTDWFVTDTAYSPSVGNTWEPFSVDVQSTGWRALDFTSGTRLGAPGAVITLPVFGTVNAVGLYIPDQSSVVRIDDVSVAASAPEPGVEYFTLQSAYETTNYVVDESGDINESSIEHMQYSRDDVLWKHGKDERRCHWYTSSAGSGDVYIINRYSGRKLKQTARVGTWGYEVDLVPGSDTSNASKWEIGTIGTNVAIQNVQYPGCYLYQGNAGVIESVTNVGTSVQAQWINFMLPHGASVPMVRYDETEYDSAGISIYDDAENDVRAYEADGESCFKLGSINWTAVEDADGCVLRYSLDDAPGGGGTNAILTIRAKKNGVLLRWKNIDLTSKYAWLYDWEGEESDDPASGDPRRVFDHIRFKFEINAGETIRIDLGAQPDADVWIDYLETEVIPPAKQAPEGSIVLVPGDDISTAIRNAQDGDIIFLSEGTFDVPVRLTILNSIKLYGAGMWYTTLHFTDTWGGINDQGGKTVDIRDLYIKGESQYRGGAGRSLTGTGWGDGSIVDSIWWDHTLNSYLHTATNLHVQNCRVYDTFAGGIIAFHHNQNLVYDNNIVKQADDDGMACYSSGSAVVPNTGWQCRYNTVEFNSRASGIGLFDTREAKVYRNLLKNNFNMGPLRCTSSFESGTGWDPYTFNEVFDNLFLDNRGVSEIYFSLKYDPLLGVKIYDNIFLGCDSFESLVYARHHTYIGWDPDDLLIDNVFVFNNYFDQGTSSVPTVKIDSEQLYGWLAVTNCQVVYSGDEPDLLVNGSDPDLVVDMTDTDLN